MELQIIKHRARGITEAAGRTINAKQSRRSRALRGFDELFVDGKVTPNLDSETKFIGGALPAIARQTVSQFAVTQNGRDCVQSHEM
jgi:hypothetical protein